MLLLIGSESASGSLDDSQQMKQILAGRFMRSTLMVGQKGPIVKMHTHELGNYKNRWDFKM